MATQNSKLSLTEDNVQQAKLLRVYNPTVKILLKKYKNIKIYKFTNPKRSKTNNIFL